MPGVAPELEQPRRAASARRSRGCSGRESCRPRASRGEIDGARDRQPDAHVQLPERPPDAARHAELEHRDRPAGPHDAHELAQRRSGVVDVAQEIGEGQRVELRVVERQRLRAALAQLDPPAEPARATRARPAASISGALVDPDDRPARAAGEPDRDRRRFPLATSSTRAGAAVDARDEERRQRGSCPNESSARSGRTSARAARRARARARLGRPRPQASLRLARGADGRPRADRAGRGAVCRAGRARRRHPRRGAARPAAASISSRTRRRRRARLARARRGRPARRRAGGRPRGRLDRGALRGRRGDGGRRRPAELRARLAEIRETEAPQGIEAAEAAAAALAETLQREPRLASTDYLDRDRRRGRARLEQALGDDAGSPFATAMQQAVPAVEELAAEVERTYKGPLA